MAHRSFANRTVALSMLAAVAALSGCTANVVGGASTSEKASTQGGGGAGGAGVGGAGGAGGGSSAGTCDAPDTTQACTVSGQPGFQVCGPDQNGNFVWSPCNPNGSAESTPLVFSFDGAPVAFASSLGAFDLAVTQSVVTDWPTASTPWLALDRNGNGAIDDGAELFGSATVLRSGERAANGFVALAELDSNGDGRITPEDAAWSSLRLWADENADRVSSAAELSPLSTRRILSIDLHYTSERRCDARNNCEVERASFRWADEAGVEHTGTIVDVHLRHQAMR